MLSHVCQWKHVCSMFVLFGGNSYWRRSGLIGECVLGACQDRAHRRAIVRCLGLRYGFAHMWRLPMRTRLVTVALGAYVHKSLAQIEWQLESGAPDCAPYTHNFVSEYYFVSFGLGQADHGFDKRHNGHVSLLDSLKMS